MPGPCGSARFPRRPRSRQGSAPQRGGFRYTRAPYEQDSWTTAFIRSARIMIDLRAPRLTVLALFGVFRNWNRSHEGRVASSALRKIASKASLATSPQPCILRSHSIRRLYPSCPTRDCLSRGQHVREDDDALPCLEPCQIRSTCRTACRCARKCCQRTEEIRSRCDRYRDQDRQYHALFGAGIRLCDDR